MEMPSITASAYTSSAVNPALFGGQMALNNLKQADDQAKADVLNAFRVAAGQQQIIQQQKKEPAIMSTARIVKVFIADPNANLPLDKRVLYSGDERLTDLTDQELFFDVPMAELLAKHNDVRKATVDKGQAEKFGRDIFLEPARIRDLKMVVVTVAQF
jgi:hypothetical protein